MRKDRLEDLLGLCVTYSIDCGVLDAGCRNSVFFVAVLECLKKVKLL